MQKLGVATKLAIVFVQVSEIFFVFSSLAMKGSGNNVRSSSVVLQ
jgi:hypothetical protein